MVVVVGIILTLATTELFKDAEIMKVKGLLNNVS